MHALHPPLPRAAFTFARLSGAALRNIVSLLAASSGRTVLDCVEIPPGVTEVHPRTRRLVRQARVSAW
jgi:hypothetical protein